MQLPEEIVEFLMEAWNNGIINEWISGQKYVTIEKLIHFELMDGSMIYYLVI